MLKLTMVLIAALPCAFSAPASIKVMSRNMDAGTDLGFVLTATDAASLAQGLAATLAEVNAANIPARASHLADEIAAAQPDLIGLQEVTLWRTGPLSAQPAGASTVLYDQLDLLMTELAKRQLHYAVAAVNSLTDAEVPVPSANLNLRLTDRDAVLVRNDVNQSVLDVYNIQTHRYALSLPLGALLPALAGITVYEGYINATVNAQGNVFQFANTHLVSLYGNSLLTLAQLGQAGELLKALVAAGPVVLVGDFNANADPGPDDSGTPELIDAAGFTDVWKALYPNDPGYTWPLYGEDQSARESVRPDERIDLIFARGLTPVSEQQTGTGFFTGLFSSDHVGLVATLQAGK